MSGASRPNPSASRAVPTCTPANMHHPARHTSDQRPPSEIHPANTTNQTSPVNPLRELIQTADAATSATRSTLASDENTLSTSAVDLEKRRRLAAANKQKEVLLQRKKEEQDRRKDKAAEEREKREHEEHKAYVQRLEEQKRLMEVELANLHNSQPDRQTMGPPLQRPMAASRLPQANQMRFDEGMPRAQSQSRQDTMIEARPQTAQLFGELDDSEMLAIKDEDLNLEGTFPPSDSFSDLGDFDTTEAEAESMAIEFDVEEALVARDVSPDENLYDDSGVCFPGEKEGLNPGKGALGNADANGYEPRRYQHIQHHPQAQRDQLIPPVQPQKPEIERPRSKGRFMNPDEADDSTVSVSVVRFEIARLMVGPSSTLNHGRKNVASVLRPLRRDHRGSSQPLDMLRRLATMFVPCHWLLMLACNQRKRETSQNLHLTRSTWLLQQALSAAPVNRV